MGTYYAYMTKGVCDHSQPSSNSPKQQRRCQDKYGRRYTHSGLWKIQSSPATIWSGDQNKTDFDISITQNIDISHNIGKEAQDKSTGQESNTCSNASCTMNEAKDTKHILNLPNKMQWTILELLPIQEHPAISCVCWPWRALAKRLWRRSVTITIMIVLILLIWSTPSSSISCGG